MIKAKNNKTIIYLILVAIVIFTIVLAFKLSAPQIENNTLNTFRATQNKTYASKLLKFSIDYPSNCALEEADTDINLNCNSGSIRISRYGTNFSNPSDFFRDLSIKNRFTIIESKSTELNTMPAIEAKITYPGGPAIEKIYYIYINYAIYSISSSSPELYSDLDQIAKSFKYTP